MRSRRHRPPGASGTAGPQGPAGSAGPAGLSSETRILRVDCSTETCQVACVMTKVMVTAYCGPSRHAATFLSENSTSYGLTPGNADSPLVGGMRASACAVTHCDATLRVAHSGAWRRDRIADPPDRRGGVDQAGVLQNGAANPRQAKTIWLAILKRNLCGAERILCRIVRS